MTQQNTFANVAIEQVASYWNKRPCNIRHSTSEVGTRQYFDEVEARKYLVEPHIPGFAEFSRWQGKKVLEIGCGIGTDTINFARAGAQVTAVDLSVESLNLAKQRADMFGLSDLITFYHANAEELSSVVPLQPYDLVYSFGVIHHTPFPERVIEQIRQHYVAPGSTVKIMVYHRHSYKVFRIVMTEGKGAFWRLDQLVAYSSEAQSGSPVSYSYTRDSVRELLEDFTITKTQVEHIFPYRIPDYVQYRYVKEWQFRYLPDPVFRWLEHQFGWHLCVTAEV
jgi:2-polyprenyl-3-methyl-5-hydroxy-6-metoxy-1,4-benzoquinol methylase